MSDLVKQLDIKASIMEMGERIAWGSDTALMRLAAREIEAKDKRIKELEATEKQQGKLLVDLACYIEEREEFMARIALLEEQQSMLWAEGEQSLNYIRELKDRIALLEAENKRLLNIIKNFCDLQEWSDDWWKKQPHIKPLFDEIAVKRNG